MENASSPCYALSSRAARLALMAVVALSALPAQALPPPGGAGAVQVTFRVNDAMIKNKMLGGVKVSVSAPDADQALATGETNAKGVFSAQLNTGKYLISFIKSGYVPLQNSKVEVGKGPSQTVTTTLTMMMEAAGQGGRRRVQIVLNWGSDPAQVRDADSHIQRGDLTPPLHVMYKNKGYATKTSSVSLDVDDTDWGGPETITLLDPPSGRYTYWVHRYSEGEGPLGLAGIKVRVLFGDRVAGEFAVPGDLTTRQWRPFKALVISPLGEPTLEPFSDDEVREGAPGQELQEVEPPADSEDDDLGPLPEPEEPPATKEASVSDGGAPAGMMDIGVVLMALFILALAFKKLR